MAVQRKKSKQNIKTQIINEKLYRALSTAMIQELNNPDLQGVSIVNVKTSPDLENASVFVSINESDEIKRKKTFTALQSAAGFLRRSISEDFKGYRRLPHISFKLDEGVQNAARVEELLNQINSKG